MRVKGWQVVPIVEADDGTDEGTHGVQVKPTVIHVRDWAAFKNGGDEEALAGLRAQVEGPAGPPGKECE